LLGIWGESQAFTPRFAAICAANVYLLVERKGTIHLGIAVLTGLFLPVMIAQIVGQTDRRKG